MAIDVYKEWLGIPEGPRPPDHYALLRLVQFEDAVDRIRGNYKKLNAHVRKYATGQYQLESQELLNELAKAMLCLTDQERKREYDIELGRKFDHDAPGSRPTLGDWLLSQKLASPAQLKEAREFAERSGLELRDAVVQLKVADVSTVTQAYAQEIGLPFVDLAELLPEEDVLDLVPKETVKQHSILPLVEDDGVVLVACADLMHPDLEEDLRMRFDRPVRTVLATNQAISQAITKYYAPGMRRDPREVAKERAQIKAGKKPAAKASGNAAKPVATPNKPARSSRQEASRETRMLGIMAICWSIIAVNVLDFYVLSPGILLDKWTFLLYGSITLPVSLGAYFFCFRK